MSNKPRIRNWMRQAFMEGDKELKNVVSAKLLAEIEEDCKKRMDAKKPKKDVNSKSS